MKMECFYVVDHTNAVYVMKIAENTPKIRRKWGYTVSDTLYVVDFVRRFTLYLRYTLYAYVFCTLFFVGDADLTCNSPATLSEIQGL